MHVLLEVRYGKRGVGDDLVVHHRPQPGLRRQSLAYWPLLETAT